MKIRSIFILILVSTAGFAQNFNDAFIISQPSIDFDARTLSLGNSTIATKGSFSSAFINPAGLATIKRDIMSISFNSNRFKNNAEFFNTKMNDERNSSNVSQFSIVLPLPTRKGNAVLAFGFTQSRDFNSTVKFDAFNPGNNSMIQDLTSFNDDLAFELGLSYPVYDSNDEYLYDETNISGRLNQSGKIIEEGNLNNWIMAGSFEISKNLFLGGTINIISGDYSRNRNYSEDDILNNFYTGLLDPADSSTLGFELFHVNDIVDWEITGWDFRLGLLYDMNNHIKLGATVKLPTYYTIDERYSIYGESVFSDNGFSVNFPGAVHSYKITTPLELSTGISTSFSLLKVNGSMSFIDYSQIEFTDGFNEDELFEKNDQINEVFQSVVNYNIGAELTLPYPALKIRGGFIYSNSPYKEDSSEFDKKYLTFGVGFPLAKRLIVDIAYAHGWWKNIGDNYAFNISRTYHDIKVDKTVLSLSYVFM